MNEQKINREDDLAGTRMLAAGNARCYRFSESGRVKKTREVLQGGTAVTCGKTRQAINGKGAILLVNISVLDSSTKKSGWVRLADLGENL